MSTTNTKTEAWSNEFPKVAGFYWTRRTNAQSPEAKVVEVWQYEGDWFVYRGGDGRDIEAEDFRLYEFLGPISPTDTAALVALRDAAQLALKAIGAPVAHPLAQDALRALRAALKEEK